MELVHDLLDSLVVDRHGREMGRVDGIVLHLPDGAPPRVARIEIGPAVLAHRLRPTFGRWVAGLEYALGIAEGRPVQIPLGDIVDMRDHIRVDRAAGHTAAAAVEHRLRAWIRKLPGWI